MGIVVNMFGGARAGLIALFFVMMAALLPVSSASAQTATITSVTKSPSGIAEGPTRGGTELLISGTNFFASQLNGVTIGGVQGSNAFVLSANEIIVTTPSATAAGPVDVVVQFANGNVTAAGAFTYFNTPPPPTITDVSPTSGPLDGGTAITITGTNFIEVRTNDLLFSDFSGALLSLRNVTVVSPTQITATTPPSSRSGNVSLQVRTEYGSATRPDSFQYLAPPVVNSLSPSTGSVDGGTDVQILGSNFSSGTTVTFGGLQATSVTFNGTTSITARTPARAEGSVDVVVTTAAGSVTRAAGFTYAVIAPPPTITSLSPTSAPTTGGTTVTVTGTNFVSVQRVTQNGSTVPHQVLSPTQLTFVTRSSSFAGDVSIQIVTAGGSTPFPGAPFSLEPVITSIGPASGAASGGTSVVITGSGFRGFVSGTPVNASAVRFGGSAATSFTVNSPTQITAQTPSGSAGAVDVSVTSGGFTVTAAGAFTYTGGSGALTITVQPTTIPNPRVGVAYSQNLTGSGGTAPYSFAITSGALPAGLSLSASGTLSGTPTAAGTFAFTATATDSAANTGSQAYTITVGAPTIVLSPTTLPTALLGQTYTQTITASGGTGPYLYFISTGLPAGMNFLTNGELSGIPTTLGTFNFTISAFDSSTGTGAPFTAQRSYTLSVVAIPAPVITGISPNSGYIAGGTSVVISGTDFTGATAVSFGGVAATSLTVNSATQITATVPAGSAGAANVVVIAPGGQGTSVGGFTYDSTPPAPTVTTVTGVSVAYGSTGTSIDLSGSVYGVSTSFEIATAPAHGTVSVAGNVITYTPAAGYYGADSFTYTATGPGGTSNAARVVLTVGVPAAPTAAAPSDVAVGYNSTGTVIDLTASVSGVSSGIVIATAPANGTVRLLGNVATYTPNAGYYGADSFTFTATGPGGTSAPATVSLTVAVPPAPTVTGRSGVAVAFNSQGTSIDLTSSVSGVASTISIVTPPARGTATVAGKVVTYTPTADSYGADSFTFTATGPGGTSAPALVSLNVAGAPPRVQPQSGSTGDGQMVSIELTRGAAIGPFTAATVVSVNPADAAKTVITSTGEGASRRFFLEATAAPRFGGTVSINYTLTNAFGVSPVGVVTLTVAARADPSKDPRVVALSDAQVQATRRFGRSQIANFMRRNEQLHSGRARSSQNVSVNVIDPTRERRPDDIMAPAAMPKRDSDRAAEEDAKEAATAAADAASVAPAAQDEKPAGVFGAMSMWVSGAIDIATRDASSFAPKLSATTQGISGGVDFQISKRTAIGFGGGYGYVTTDISDKAAELRASSNLVAVYGSTKLFENGFVDVVAGRGFLDYKTRRRIDGTELTALGTRSGTMNLAAVSFGINKQVKALDWSFYSKLEYMDARLAAYTETSGGTRNNLRLSALDDTSYSAGLGFRLQKAYATGIGQVTPRLRGEFGREFGKADVQYVDYADIAGTKSRGIQGRHNEQNFYQTSIGTMIDLKDDWSFDLEYALMYNTATLSSGIKVQVSRAF